MIDYSIPALLFPAITLLFLAFTNRFLAIATLIRNLSAQASKSHEPSNLQGQIKNLTKRLSLIKYMQIFGILSFVFCVITMIFIYEESDKWAKFCFGMSLVLLLVSLALSLIETQISTKALKLELHRMKED